MAHSFNAHAHRAPKRGGKPGPRVRWTTREREEWHAALTREAIAHPNATGIATATAAMKHMERKRSLTSADLVVDANKVLKEVRTQAAQPQPPAPPAAPAAPAPEALDAEQAVAATEQHAYETLEMPSSHWTDALTSEISRVLIEVIVRTAESVAVRKAVRSLVAVATDTNFRPEVDNTTPWERPKVGPNLPRVLVVGFHRPKPVEVLARRWGKLLDLRFWRVTHSLNQLKQDLTGADVVVHLTGSGSHSVYQIVVASRKPLITLPMAGGLSMVDRELQRIVDQWKEGRAVH